ncbi:MAG: PD-(D/E)XK nuclease-like domain-containing protein [Bacillus sp. (in: firmicutes)]
MNLTKDNYYTREADLHYMSVSQYKSFLKCEAATMAKLRGEYEQPKSDALLFGSYVHSWLEGDLDNFKANNPELFSSRGSSKGELKAQYSLADKMIAALKSDPMCMFALDGEKEVIMTGELFGAPWKIRMDVYNPQNGRFADLKTVKGIHERYWHNGAYTSFMEAFGYIIQLAVYSEIENQNRGGDWLESYIVAVSKQDPPDKAIIVVDQERLIIELGEVEKNMERIIQVKSGLITPNACSTCDYCRRNKQIKSVTHYLELIS